MPPLKAPREDRKKTPGGGIKRALAQKAAVKPLPPPGPQVPGETPPRATKRFKIEPRLKRRVKPMGRNPKVKTYGAPNFPKGLTQALEED